MTPGRLELPALNTTEYLTVGSASEPLRSHASPQAEWCTAVVEGARMRIRVSTNLGAERSVTLHVTAGRFTQDVVLVQRAFDPVRNYGDGEVVALQRATSETACVGRRGGRLYACRDGPGNGEV